MPSVFWILQVQRVPSVLLGNNRITQIQQPLPWCHAKRVDRILRKAQCSYVVGIKQYDHLTVAVFGFPRMVLGNHRSLPADPATHALVP